VCGSVSNRKSEKQPKKEKKNREREGENKIKLEKQQKRRATKAKGNVEEKGMWKVPVHQIEFRGEKWCT
jgi:hemolysin activation/secretion protein